MFKHVNSRWALALAASTAAVLMLAVGASAGTGKVSFKASKDGASAGWSAGKGSAIELELGTSAGSFAEVTLHVKRTVVGDLAEPTFATDNYNAGSPRYYITLSDGNSLWGYPPQAGVSNGSTFGWSIDNTGTYMSWSAVQAAEGGATVTGAYVIADADQSAGTVDEITGLTFGAVQFN